MAGPLQVNRLLLNLALQPTSAFRKGAVAVAGGDPAAMGGMPPGGGDPMAAMGGMPPGGGDPMAAMGGAAPPPAPGAGMDPAAQAQMMMAGGGAGGAGGRAGGKKLEQQVTDARLYRIERKIDGIAEALQVKFDASDMTGPAPDPAVAQMADQDAMAGQPQPSLSAAGDPAAAAGGAAAGAAPAGGGGAIGTVDPMKAASVLDPFEAVVPGDITPQPTIAQRARARSMFASALLRR
jgi:hypothetical protein